MYTGIPNRIIHSVNRLRPIAPKHTMTNRTQAASMCHANINTSRTEFKFVFHWKDYTRADHAASSCPDHGARRPSASHRRNTRLVASVGRVWTAPWVQGVRQGNFAAVRLRSCVRPVCRGSCRWPRWVPRSTPKRKSDLAGRHPTRVLWIVGPTDQHLFPRALHPRQTSDQAVAGAGR